MWWHTFNTFWRSWFWLSVWSQKSLTLPEDLTSSSLSATCPSSQCSQTLKSPFTLIFVWRKIRTFSSGPLIFIALILSRDIQSNMEQNCQIFIWLLPSDVKVEENLEGCALIDRVWRWHCAFVGFYTKKSS